MKTTKELEQETEKADQAFDDCRARLRLEICKDPEYLRTAAAADAAYKAYAKSKGLVIPRNLTVVDTARPAALWASGRVTRISTVF